MQKQEKPLFYKYKAFLETSLCDYNMEAKL